MAQRFQTPGATPSSLSKRAVTRRKAVRRIPLKSLEALSADEVAVGNRLLRLLPAPVPGQRLLDELADEAERLTGLPHDVFFHAVRTYAGSEFCARLDEHLTTTFTLAPDPDLGVITVDMNLVGGWLEELLEDEPPEARTLAPPSARDFGLVTFLLMQLVNWLCKRGLPPLSVPSSPPNLETAAQRLRRQSEISEVVYAVSTPTSAGLVRLFVPGDMVRSMEVFVAESTRRQRQRRRLSLSRLGSLRARLPLTVARVGLTPPELDELGVGDVLLPADHALRMDGLDDGARGHGELGLDAAASTILPCVVRPQGQQLWKIEITDATPVARQPHGGEMDSQQSSEQPPSNEPAADVLDKAQVAVEIRLGEMPLPVSMLAQIQSGYVLELERRVDDGVDLVVDGKRIGAGELVNVDGRLGVRVLSIAD